MSSRDEWTEREAVADLDPFDRMLLSADGTVTALLEACTGEPIATRTTRQAGPATLDTLLAATGRWWHPDPTLLELAPAERLIARRALLLGTRSENPLRPGRIAGRARPPTRSPRRAPHARRNLDRTPAHGLVPRDAP